MLRWLKNLFGRPKSPPPPITPAPPAAVAREVLGGDGPVWLQSGRRRMFTPVPTSAWWDGSSSFGRAGRLIELPVRDARSGREVMVVRPLRWLRDEARRQRRRGGPKVVRDDSPEAPRRPAPQIEP